MHNFANLKCFIDESMARNLIFDACRANEKRADWKNAEGFKVNFVLFADGNCEAILRNHDGIIVAMAVVDETDV